MEPAEFPTASVRTRELCTGCWTHPWTGLRMRVSDAELTTKGLCAGSLDTSTGEVPFEKVPLRAGAEE